MGHFSYTCGLTGLPITDGTKVVLLPMKIRKNSFKLDSKYGENGLISNDGTNVRFQPFCLPIKGEYGGYGNIVNIIEDENTKLLEEYFGLTITEICGVILSGRKDDGFDKKLDIIKESVVCDGRLEGEDAFGFYKRTQNDPMPFGDNVYPTSNADGTFTVYVDGKQIKNGTKEQYEQNYKLIHEQYGRYSEWLRKHPEHTVDFKYKPGYEELLSLYSMWIHGEFYEQNGLIRFEEEYENINPANPSLLKYLGFKYVKDVNGSSHYDYNGFNVYIKEERLIDLHGISIYSVSSLKDIAKKEGVDLNIDVVTKMDIYEQIMTFYVESNNSLFDTNERFIFRKSMTMEQRTLAHVVFGNPDYMETLGETKLPFRYFRKLKEGKLKEEFISFRRFDLAMFNMGKYYDLNGTSPQDGDHKGVLRTLEIAYNIQKKKIEEIDDYEI